MIRIAAISLALLALWISPARAVSSFTQCLTLQQPATGDQTNSWGATVNTNWSIVDNGLAALQSLSLPAQSGYPTVMLTFNQGGTDQAKYARFNFTGTLTADTTVLWPNGRCGRFVAQNSTSGAFNTTLCVNNGSGACAGGSAMLPQGQTAAFYSDGTNIVPETNAVDGPLAVAGNFSAGGTLTATGAAALNGGLSVSGTTTLGSALSVPNGGTGASALGAHGILVGEGAGAVAATSPGTLGQVLTSNGPAADPSFQANAALTVLRDYIAGLILSNDGTSPNTTLDIAPGMATSDDATVYMTLASGFTKTTGSWAAGSGNGALDTGSLAANTWYHVFEIERTDTGVVDVLFSLSATSPTLPASYTKKRRVGSFKTAATSTNIVAFLQHDDYFYWSVPTEDYDNTIGTTARDVPLNVPTGVSLRPIFAFDISGAPNTTAHVFSPTAPDNSLWDSRTGSNASGETVAFYTVQRTDVYTDINGQVRMIASGSAQATFNTFGWVDPRGRNQ